MMLLTLCAAALTAGLASAQTAPGFPIVVTNHLPVTYVDTNTTVSPPGVLLPRSQVLTAPAVSPPAGAAEDSTYVLFMIDQDVVRNNTRVNLLHWFQYNLIAGSNGSLVANADAEDASTAMGASYVPPTPPGGSGSHRYTFIIFPQPADFAVPDSFAAINPPAATTDRIGFNLTTFVAQAGLAAPLAANYLQVLNGTAAESASVSSSLATMTAAMASATASNAVTQPSQFAGDAAELKGHGKELVLGLAMGVVGAGFWVL